VIERLLPGLSQLRGYDRLWLRGDVVAGVTVAAYAIPQTMAYAQVAGLSPVVGLWSLLAPMVVYAFVGSSRQLSVGPESTISVMAATAVAPLADGDPALYATLAAACALVVGVMCFVGYLFRLGFLADLLSHPILVGYMAGVAVIMAAGQLDRMVGIDVDASSAVGSLGEVVRSVDEWDVPSLVLGLGVLVFLFVCQWRFPRAPAPLLGVLVATAIVAVFQLDEAGIAVVGEIPAGLPSIRVPAVNLDDLVSLLAPAFGIALVGFSDNVLDSRAFAARNGYTIDANQELLALSAANVGTGLTQGLPVSSSGSRTAIGVAVGSRTQLFSLVGVASILVVIVFFRPVLADFPLPALGAIVIYAAVLLVNVPEFVRLRRFRPSEFLLALAACFGVIAFDILYGVAFAIGLSAIEMLARVARPHDGILGRVPGLAGMHDVDDHPTAQTIPGLVVYRYDAPLFFANAENFRERALEAVHDAPYPVEWFVLNAEANVDVDITALDAVEEVRAELAGQGIVFAMARVKQDLRDELERVGLVERIGEAYLFPTLPTAVEAFEARSSRPGTELS
jgi:high affinity sulfate transporter 1